MNRDYEEPPPSYTEVMKKSVHHVSHDRPAVPPPEQARGPRYTSHNTTIPNVSRSHATPLVKLNQRPIPYTCHNCHSSIVTYVERTAGTLVWLLCCILVVFGCWLGCCLIPFCIRGIQNARHYCPNCKAFIGEYRPL